MATTTVVLEPRNMAASVRFLKAEFEKAKLSGVKTSGRNGALHVEMPIGHLAGFRFAYDQAHCSWKTPGKKVVVELSGLVVEQRTSPTALHVIFRAAQTAVPKAGSRVRDIFLKRSMRAIEDLQQIDEKKLAEAVQAPTDYSVLVSALNTDEALTAMRDRDPLAGARLRGMEAKRKLIEAEGGALSSSEAAAALRITRQAVDKRRKEGKLLAVELGRKGFRFPAWQIGLRNLEKVLGALRDRDGWEQLAFFLNPSGLLGGRTPLEVLQEGRHDDVADVIRAARVSGEQGA